MIRSRRSCGIRWAGTLLTVALSSGSLYAQPQYPVQWVFVKSGPLAAMQAPSHESGVVVLLETGTWLEVVEARDDWYRVLLPKGEIGRTERSAWVPAALVARASGPAGSPPPAKPPATAPADATAGAPARPAHSARRAPPPRRAPEDRYFLSVNGALQERSLTFQDSRTEPFYAETSSWTARYGVRSGYGFDAGGGVRLWRGLAAAVAISRFEEEKRTAEIAGEIPHPFHFDQPRAISGESQSLGHSEQAVHASAAWMLPPMGRFHVLLFAGPSFFSVSRDLVEDVDFSETYPYNTASYERALLRSVSGSQAGFHGGVDVTWSITPRVGVGAVARYARAEMVLDSPAHERGLAVDAGGIQAGAGLRVRLGGWR